MQQKGRVDLKGVPTVIPVPEMVQKLLRSPTSNFGLFFYRMMPWELENGVPRKPKDFISTQNDWALRYRPDSSLLERRHASQLAFLREVEKQGGISLEIEAELTAPFVSGLGAGHPSETGLMLDRNLGCIYLPAPSIKGAMKHAHTLQLMREQADIYNWRTDEELIQSLHENSLPVRIERDKKSEIGGCVINDAFLGLQSWFGSLPGANYQPDPKDPQGMGRLVVLDAFPEGEHRLEIDILNPHYPNYYQDKGRKNGPTEDQNPVPITFWQMKKGASFMFRFVLFPKPLLDGESWVQGQKEKLKVQLVRIWAKAAEFGFGGKTAIGYGRFKATGPSCAVYSEKDAVPEPAVVKEVLPHDKPIELSPVEKLKKELAMIKPDDAGRIGTILQKIASLETPLERAQMARAVKDHLGDKRFRKHKRIEDLLSWMEAVSQNKIK